MDRVRREILGRFGTTTVLATSVAAGLLRPSALLAAWHGRAFDARRLTDALRASGIATPPEAGDIVVEAPELSENAAFVALEATSRIQGTEAILVFAEKNAWPHIARFNFSDEALPTLAMRLRLAESSLIHVVVRAGGTYYMAAKHVTVTAGGCTQEEAAASASEPMFKPQRTRIRARLRGDVADVLVLIRHPMENGLRKLGEQQIIPEHFIRELSVQLNGSTRIEAELGRGVSANPLFKFQVKHARPNDRVLVRWRDNQNLQRIDEARVIPA